MTADKQELPELLPCPFCGGADLEEDWDGMTTIYGIDHQSCWVNCNECNISTIIQCKEENGEKMHDCLVRLWNTRPAKAVGGDKAEALEWITTHLENSRRMKQSVPPENFHGVDINKNIRVMECIAAALTPESEGIAGKGDKAVENEKIKKRLMEKPDQFWANGNLMADEVQVIKESLTNEPTIARPQEIDVEALKDALEIELVENNNDGTITGIQAKRRAVRETIDHLFISGYLSAPDGKKQ